MKHEIEVDSFPQYINRDRESNRSSNLMKRNCPFEKIKIDISFVWTYLIKIILESRMIDPLKSSLEGIVSWKYPSARTPCCQPQIVASLSKRVELLP